MQFKNTLFTGKLSRSLVFDFILLLAACGGGNGNVPTTVAADFSAQGIKGTVSERNVTLDLSGLGNCATNIEKMVVSVSASGYSVSPDPAIARDYSAPVDFTITAPDGSKVVYTVTVKGAACLGSVPAPTPACTAATINPAEPYSLVFKGCDANNVATYYDKTECVRQNSTGLIWQGQTPAGTGLRANDQYKTNFDSTTELQKWNGTTFVTPTQAEVDAITNSIGFKNAVNATNLCGSSAWRLPTKDELLGIVKINAAAPMIDTDWFPNTLRFGLNLSASPYQSYAYRAWGISFYDGIAYDINRDHYYGNSNALVRLVH